jgi:DNA-directed RNA polymerase specialized sigma24 family protein
VDSRTPRPWIHAGQDPELLRKAQRGDLTALLRIYNTHRLSLWRACLVLARQAAEAEVLFQETIARATRELADAPAHEPLLPWRAGLARELDATRASTRPRDPALTSATRPNGRPWDDGSSGPADTLVEQRALQAFSLLPADDQWVLALRVFERLSYADIARVTGQSPERVADRLALAREAVDETCNVEDRAA